MPDHRLAFGKEPGEHQRRAAAQVVRRDRRPVQTLRAFKRVAVGKGRTVNVSFTLDDKTFEWFDTTTNTMRPLKGAFTIRYGGSSDPKQQKTIAFDYQ